MSHPEQVLATLQALAMPRTMLRYAVERFPEDLRDSST
jgi:hypothetical protein